MSGFVSSLMEIVVGLACFVPRYLARDSSAGVRSAAGAMRLPGATILLIGLKPAMDSVFPMIGDGRLEGLGEVLIWALVGVSLLIPMWMTKDWGNEGLHITFSAICAFPGLFLVFACAYQMIHISTTQKTQLEIEKRNDRLEKANEEARRPIAARQNVQNYWNEVLGRLDTGYASAGSFRHMKAPDPVMVVSLLRASSDMGAEAKKFAKAATGGDQPVAPEWEPIFDSLNVAAYCLITGNEATIEALDTGHPSKVVEARQQYDEFETRVVAAIRDGRELYVRMGGEASALSAYNFKP